MMKLYLLLISILIEVIAYIFFKYTSIVSEINKLLVYWILLPIIYVIVIRITTDTNKIIKNVWFPFVLPQFVFLISINVYLPPFLVHGFPYLFFFPFIFEAFFIKYFFELFRRTDKLKSLRDKKQKELKESGAKGVGAKGVSTLKRKQ